MRDLFKKHSLIVANVVAINTVVCVIVGARIDTETDAIFFTTGQALYGIPLALYMLFCMIMVFTQFIKTIVTFIRNGASDAIQQFIKGIMWFVHCWIIMILGLFPLGFLAMGLGL